MGKITILFLVSIWCLGLITPQRSYAENDHLSVSLMALEEIKDRPEWVGILKEHHHLSSEHIQWMLSKGLNYPQMHIVSFLSERSGKTVDDILEMKNHGQDWKKIAQSLEISLDEMSAIAAATKSEIIKDAEKTKEAQREESPKAVLRKNKKS